MWCRDLGHAGEWESAVPGLWIPSPECSCGPINHVVAWRERSICELVAQLVEQRPFKAWVLGSSPSELTTQKK